MADKRLRTMVFPGLEDTYTIPQDMNDLESIEAVAEPYDEFASYAIGDYCSNGGKFYRCNTAIPSGETWNANHWTETNVGDEILAEKSATSTALSGKVSKSGDTMTGELIVQNSAISAKSTTADTTDDAPSATTYWDTKHTDKNNRVAAYWETSYSTTGTSRTTLRARRNVNGSNVNNGFALEVNKNGGRIVSFDEPAAWRSALGLEAVEFNLTRTSAASSGSGVGIYEPGLKTVRINGWAKSDTDIATGVAVFTVPSEYRPSSNKYGSAIIINSSGAVLVYSIAVNASGNVYQSYTNATRGIYFYIEYTL